MTAGLLIGRLAERAGVNAKTIRYYEEIGLLRPPRRTGSGYRVYDEDDVERLRFIRRAQKLDLRLDEIGEILALRDGGERPCGYVLDVAAERLADLDRRIAEMQAARDDLAHLLTLPDAAPTTADDDGAGFCPLIEHHRRG